MKTKSIGALDQSMKPSSCEPVIPVLGRSCSQAIFKVLAQRCFLALLFTALAGNSLWAQTQEGKSTITGHATDVNHDPLVGAKVELQPLGQTAVTDAQGGFKIADIRPGKYTVAISYVGFTSFSKEVTVAAGGTVNVEAELQIETVTEQVIVRGERERGEIEALNREETADNIVQVLPAEVITSLPNTNIADALGRLPSVSLERDEGEGKYVQIRGTEPRLSNVTVDGVHLPSPEAVRNVKLDAIPADLVDSVEINKTLSANQEGDAIGGSVNLVTKKPTDQPYVTLLGMGGRTPTDGGRGLYQFNGTAGARFGREKRFGVMFGASYDWNGRGYDDVEDAPGTTAIGSDPAVPVFFGQDMRQYWFDRKRFGYATDVDYKLGAASFLYFRGIFSQFNDNGEYWVYAPNVSNFVSSTATTATSAPSSFMQYKDSDRNPWQQIFNGTAGAQHTLGSNTIGYEFSGGQARFLGGFPKYIFNGPGANGLPGDTPITFLLDTSNPHNPTFIAQNGVDIFDPTKYVLSQVKQQDTRDKELDYTGSIFLTHSYRIGTRFGALDIGFKVRDADKAQFDIENFYNPVVGSGPILMSQFLRGWTNPHYYNGAYKYGPVTAFGALNRFFAANPSLFSFDVNTTHANADANIFDASERVYAGYVMNTITLGHVRLQGGVRFESTKEAFVGTQATFDPSGNFVSDTKVPGQQSYTDVLPSVQATYSFGNSMNIRAAYGRGIARPNFSDLPPSASVNEGAVGSLTKVSMGNPNLLATHANNFDVLFEKYLKTVGIIQAGWFYKALTDPIFSVQTTPTTGPFANDQVTQPINGPNAHIQGVEMSWEQHLNSLPGLLSGLGVSANYSYVASQASFPSNSTLGRTDKPRLLRNAPNNWNFDTVYDKGPISARLGLTHNDADIWVYNYANPSAPAPPPPPNTPLGLHGPNGDIYLFPHTQVDVQASYRIPRMHDLQAVVSVLNLTNEVFGFYQGSEKYPIQREYYNRTYSFGLRWTPSFGRK